MKRVLCLMLLLLMSCRMLTPAPTSTPQPSPTHSLPAPTATITNTPIPLDPVTPTLPAQLSGQLSRDDFILRTHPDGGLYIGDLVSLEVIALKPEKLDGMEVSIDVAEGSGELGLQAFFGRYGIGGRMQATLTWAWNTRDLAPGDYEIDISIPSENLSWQEVITLLPADQVPQPEPQASWKVAETDCCLVYYISGTEAERDLSQLQELLEDSMDNASRLLVMDLDEPVDITFLPRVLGHGGFAGTEISVSYLDRNYATSNSQVVLQHEIVHALDWRNGGDIRPSLLSEGLAVYLTGGHFKPEPLIPRAAALLSPQPGCSQAQDILSGQILSSESSVCGLDWYLPLVPLIDNFYLSQHEIGYLQAASLVEFMVNSWGWKEFEAFYRDIHPDSGPPAESTSSPDLVGETLGPQAAAMNTALVKHFNLTIHQLEDQYLAALQRETLQPKLVEDVRLSVSFFDTVRRYQQYLDPSAYFLTAWLPDSKSMREQGLVADFLRRPSKPDNLALEVMLVNADADIQSGAFTSVQTTLQSINNVLDKFDSGQVHSAWTDALAAQYYEVVSLLLASGYHPQRILLQENTAQAWVVSSGPNLELISLQRQPAGWVIMESTQNPVPQ